LGLKLYDLMASAAGIGKSEFLTRDGRVLFAAPWLGKVILVTTDTPRVSFSALCLIYRTLPV
jgi:hypothetical protein